MPNPSVRSPFYRTHFFLAACMALAWWGPVAAQSDKELPGMQASVDIITGKKTILQFLSKPLVALRENSFRER